MDLCISIRPKRDLFVSLAHLVIIVCEVMYYNGMKERSMTVFVSLFSEVLTRLQRDGDDGGGECSVGWSDSYTAHNTQVEFSSMKVNVLCYVCQMSVSAALRVMVVYTCTETPVTLSSTLGRLVLTLTTTHCTHCIHTSNCLCNSFSHVNNIFSNVCVGFMDTTNTHTHTHTHWIC